MNTCDKEKELEFPQIPYEAHSGPEWIRPSPTREKAWSIATWIMFVISTIFFIGCGVMSFVIPESENANPKVAVFFLIPIIFWYMLRAKEVPPIRGVRIADGDALQVETDDGIILTITYYKLAGMWHMEQLHENGRYFSPRTDGYYVGWRGGPQLSRHDIGRLGVSGKSFLDG